LFVLIVIALVTIASEPGWPDRIGEVERLDDSLLFGFGDGGMDIRFGDARLIGAVYGREGLPELIVMRFAGEAELSGFIPLESFWEGALGGFESTSGATLARDTSTSADRDGVEYRCIAFEAPQSATAFERGTICAWRGRDIGLLVTSETTSSTAAIDVAERVYRAIEPHR
jgi:hypothetical protein